MCTCIALESNDFYFGRNLDLTTSFGEGVLITPRAFPLRFWQEPPQRRHFAMIGMAAPSKELPLYAEAVNEKGLGMAGLHFPGNAVYPKGSGGRRCVAPYELIAWVLGQCAAAEEAAALCRNLVLAGPPEGGLPLAPLHWMLADREACFVLEQTESGMQVWENRTGVLTNNPPFPFHLQNLRQYRHLSTRAGENRFAPWDLAPFGEGFGAIGLPGDASPASRFVRAAFYRANASLKGTEADAVSQFFHILDAVAMVRGSVVAEDGAEDETVYSCCVNASRGIYYYKTYGNSRLEAVHLFQEDLDSDALIPFALEREWQVHMQNGGEKEWN